MIAIQFFPNMYIVYELELFVYNGLMKSKDTIVFDVDA